MTAYSQLIEKITNQLKARFDRPLDYAVVLGSGLSDIVDGANILAEVELSEIEGLPTATAPSHRGKILFCEIADKVVALCQGRLHLYEGYSAEKIVMLVYALRNLGAEQLIITNAAGSLNEKYNPGDVMVIQDHINFTGHNPLISQDGSLSSRFTDMSQAYSRELSSRAFTIANDLDMPLHLGVYAGVTGPSLETSAERRMLRICGADAVGMSTVMEVIAANHCGMQVLGLSAITNSAIGDQHQQVDSIEEVLRNAAIAGQGIQKILQKIIAG